MIKGRLPPVSIFLKKNFMCFHSGAYQSVMAVILVDILGLDRIASSFGLTVLFQGAAIVAGPPIAGTFFFQSYSSAIYVTKFYFYLTESSGAIRDGTGSYVYSFLWGGGVMVFGAILILSRKAWLSLQQQFSRDKLRKVWKSRRNESMRPLNSSRS